MRARRAVTLCIGVVPLLLLGACGDDDGTDTSPQARAFCAVADPVKRLSGVLESEDPAVIEAAFTGAEAALASVAGDPPQDIATDVATIKTHFTAANDALKKASYDVDQIDRSASKAISDLEDAEFTKAGDNVQVWTTKNCA
ncbi:MAG TPA: hypothetical protein VM282_05900 [Acidimicrobiales bacterium]|nr:hypothetical protein [Acidimicrobiales bacterium]